MKKFSILLSALLIISFLLAGCAPAEEPTEPFDSVYHGAVSVYEAFAQTAIVDWSKAVTEYCHFSDPADLERSQQGEPNHSMELIRFEKLSDTLWVVELCVKDELCPNGLYGVNYVGFYDGAWRVFLNLKDVPAELTEGVEIEPYEPHGPDVL